MSGGSYDYAFARVKDMAEDPRVMRSDNPRRRAFAKLLLKVSKAMRDIEWVDSCDSSEGDEDASIEACISNAEIVEAEWERLELAIGHAKSVLERFGK